MIKRLELKNFTAFEDISIDFSPKINVIIGENGTGKTHLLKIIYALCGGGLSGSSYANQIKFRDELTHKLIRLFMPLESKLGKMHRQGASESASIKLEFPSGKFSHVQFFNNSTYLKILEQLHKDQSGAVFIPTKEVLSLVKGLNQKSIDIKTIQAIFDDSYLDLSDLLLQPAFDDPTSKIKIDPRFGDIVLSLVDIIGGKYQWENGDFCFRSGKYENKTDYSHSRAQSAQMYQDSSITRFVPSKEPLYPISMTAEGFRKIGVIHRLLCNGSLDPGITGPLIWDEPESNLNPKLMDNLVKVLIELSRNGQQIILATHDYVLLKWIDLLTDKGKGDHVLFHTLYKEPNTEALKIESVDDYLSVHPNAIAETFNDLTKMQVRLKMGGLGQ